mmetsp:Transcript_90158/g.268934  ORF Transcript_90158/g.268934 Transcript_90158/m.268934 type:complete len:267 (+) Transcript_90158:184-984(+)
MRSFDVCWDLEAGGSTIKAGGLPSTRLALRKTWALGSRGRPRRAMSTGSFSSLSPRTTSTSTPSMQSSSAASASLAASARPRCAFAAAPCRSRSTDISCRSTAMAGPRSREQPRKKASVSTRPPPRVSRRPWSCSSSATGMPSMTMRSRTARVLTIAASSSRSSSPLSSASASRKISRSDSMTTASFRCRSFSSASSFARALERVVSTMEPTMVFMRARPAATRKATKRMTRPGYLLIRGQARDSDHLSPVKTWKSEYMDWGTVPQ